MTVRLHARLTGCAALAFLALVGGITAAHAATPRLRISLGTTTVRVVTGSPLVVRGTIVAAGRRYTVLLQRRSGSRWATVQTRRAGTRGAFAFSLVVRAPASARYRVVAGSAAHPAVTSRVIEVAVRGKAVPATPPISAPPVAPSAGGVVIGTSVLPFGALGVAYRARLSTTDARTGTWTVASGTLPPGLTLAPSGVVTGTPAGVGTSSFVVAFADASQASASRRLTLSVFWPPAVSKVATGRRTACALRVDGTVACWGGGGQADLGTLSAGISGTLSTPVQVDDLTDATDIGVGDSMACALHATGVPICWTSDNDHGDLGNGTRLPARTPTPVSGVTDAVAIAVGGFACVLHRGGTVSCWGGDTVGQLGDGTFTDAIVPVSVVGISDARQISVGEGHACALHATGTVSCWGEDGQGQLGNGTTVASSNVPVVVSGLAGATAISAGWHDTCAVLTTGSVVCWGAGAYGALGDGTTADSSTPVAVAGLSDAATVSVGDDGDFPAHDGVCALRATGGVSCWGAIGPGRADGGSTVTVPLPAGALSGVTALAVGGGYGCAVESGHPFCWGYDQFGRLGFPTDSGSPFLSAPTLVPGV